MFKASLCWIGSGASRGVVRIGRGVTFDPTGNWAAGRALRFGAGAPEAEAARQDSRLARVFRSDSRDGNGPPGVRFRGERRTAPTRRGRPPRQPLAPLGSVP